jgi:hypothetical protein
MAFFTAQVALGQVKTDDPCSQLAGKAPGNFSLTCNYNLNPAPKKGEGHPYARFEGGQCFCQGKLVLPGVNSCTDSKNKNPNNDTCPEFAEQKITNMRGISNKEECGQKCKRDYQRSMFTVETPITCCKALRGTQ